uniref:Cytochrome P450 86A2 n=1 Tax=Aegilops tauschii TaxID=37682 RepID=M8C5H2_AEGTA
MGDAVAYVEPCMFRHRDGLPTNWPVVGALPAITVKSGRVHEWVTEFLRVAPGMSHVVRGPWGSPVDVLVTANPADVAHVFTANFGNYPKGEDFAAVFDVLGDGIFNADGESWAFQRRKAHALLFDPRFRSAVAASTARKLGEGLVPLLDGLAATCEVVDLQDVFMRLTFDLTAMFVFGVDPGCLAAHFPRVPFAAAMDEAEAVLFYRHVTPVPWLRLQTYLNIGHERKMAKARQVLDASITEFVSLRRERAARADTNADGTDAADLLTLYLACQDEAVWGKDCLEFRPERWLTETGRLRHEPSYKFVAFNVGPRTCIGKDLAFTQMKAVVAAVVPRFRVEVAAGATVPIPKMSIILHMKDGLKVRVHKRQDDALSTI